MNDKKMIVVDLDGTLLDINGCCSNNTKRYLKKLKKLGYIVVIATGRVLRSAINITDGAEFANYIVANAGALIYDRDNFKIIMKKNISIDNVKMVCNLFNGEIDYINLCDLYNYNRCFGNDKIDYCCEKIINNVDEFIAEADNILHITIKLKDNDLVNKYYNKINKYNLETIIMQDSFTDRRWLEIFNKGVSKYDAINVIASIEKIENNNIISFGDGLNDLDMLEKSGIGVAMGNALGLVKEVSDYVTLSHNDDGVIYFLKEYLSISNYVD